ncbi:hypothetical protein Pan44_31430 [Caulifigura coniformis]|uniref:Uncharacterized protein n=1 Tax=Caulifigura coniformis TaxID=2527983 RepID=A0A517SG50_9PLAN|nr:hypothetical protein [Caulifigura coniformis]QDT55101.1 hypothetical protein Pan44_31430 [Caulifigura coniformis]
MRFLSTCLGYCSLIVAGTLFAGEGPPFRIDADGPINARPTRAAKGSDKKDDPQWYPLIDGRFPPEGSAHAISGELIQVDHLERRFHLRVDRNDSQDRSIWDLPLDAVMLPYGSISYHGSPAALQDIPLGTHLHGEFYLRAANDQTPPPAANNNRKTPELDFRRCFRLEDDFTHHARNGRTWKVASIDPSARKLIASLERDGVAVGKPQSFDFTPGTRVYRGTGFAKLTDLAPGESVLFNLTWTTLYGPGRITEIWLDESSRELAAAHQLECHRQHIRERGLAGWVEAVDDELQIVTITFFGGIDPALFDELTLTNPEPFGWPLSKPEDRPTAPKGTIAVARESLMTYDPVNDRKGGNILEIERIPVEPGSSGVRLRVQCDMLLEGFRPRRIVRFYPATWKVVALPREEQFFGRE